MSVADAAIASEPTPLMFGQRQRLASSQDERSDVYEPLRSTRG